MALVYVKNSGEIYLQFQLALFPSLQLSNEAQTSVIYQR